TARFPGDAGGPCTRGVQCLMLRKAFLPSNVLAYYQLNLDTCSIGRMNRLRIADWALPTTRENRAWQRGEWIMLPGPEAVPLPRTEDWPALKEAVKRFEHAWRQGQRPAIDEYLPADDALRTRVLIELVHIDLELRLKAGEKARIEDYTERHKELATSRA